MSDEELIVASKSGDLAAFCELVKRYQGHVSACLVVRLDSSQEAEDLAQEAFVTAYNCLDQLENERAFGSWVRTIALNRLRNYRRKSRPITIGGSEELEALVEEKIDLLYAAPCENDAIVALRHCMDKLPQAMRELVELRYYRGFGVNDLSDQLGVRHSTMTMRLHRMRETLRRCIAAQIEGGPA